VCLTTLKKKQKKVSI